MSKVSTLGAELASIARLSRGQSSLSSLSEQLSSGIKSSSLSDYSTTEAKNLLDLNASLARKTAYLDSVSAVETRISVYDDSLTGIESIASEAVSLCSTSSAYNSTTNSTTASSVLSYMQEVEYYLNQEVGGRYVFAGTRYDTAPVTDITTLPTLTTASTVSLVTDPTLPDYDSECASLTTSAAAYVEDTVTVDANTKLTYGISSDNSAFQNLVLGLRYAYAATQDSTNYTTLMAQAQTYIQKGLSEVESVHAGLSSDAATLEGVNTRLTNDKSSIANQITDIQSVDTNEVSVKITSQQTQIEAAYSATSKLLTLSILNYL